MKKRFKKIYLEVTNNCNLDCSFCSKNNRVKKFIGINDFTLFLNKIKKYTDHIYFHVMGEPLLHPKINELIDLASKDFNVNITTNGYLIDRIKENKNIRKISISLHSFDSKYNKTLEDYLNNIFEIVELLLSNNTYVEYRLWVNAKDKEEIIKRIESKYNIKINNENFKIKNKLFFEMDKEFIWPSLDNDYYNEMGGCLGTRDQLGILVDGTVVPCCLDNNGIINLGNIYKNNLDDIINSNLFEQINKGFLSNKKVHPLCRKCSFYELRR